MALRNKVYKEEMMFPSAMQELGNNQVKYCHCVIEVGSKQSEKCLRERAWGKTIDGEMCYNPYAICAKTTGGSNKECGKLYNYVKLSTSDLMTYAALNRIDLQMPLTHENVLNSINAWKMQKYGSS